MTMHLREGTIVPAVEPSRYAHLAPLPLRLSLGATFLAHGLAKLMAASSVAPLFAQIGLPVPYFMTLLVGAVECGGGLLVLLGQATRLAAGMLALVMLGAIALVKFKQGFVNGWEFDLALLAGALSLVLSGPRAQRST